MKIFDVLKTGTSGKEDRMTNWRKHEERAKSTKYAKDFEMRWNKPSISTGKRPDGWGIHKTDKKRRIIIEDKWAKKGKKSHVDQVQRYKQHPFYAKEGVLVYPQNAILSEDFKAYAKKKNVTITRTRVPKVKKPSGFLKYLVVPEYER